MVRLKVLARLDGLAATRNKVSVLLRHEEPFTLEPGPCFAQCLVNALVSLVMAHDRGSDSCVQEVPLRQVILVRSQMLEKVREGMEQAPQDQVPGRTRRSAEQS